MSKFRLVKKSSNPQISTFQVLDGEGSICGSINVQTQDEAELLRCWSGATTNAPAARTSASAMVAAFMKHRSPLSKAALLGDVYDCPLMDLNNSSGGVAAMVRAAVWFDDQLGLEILSIGRAGLDRKDSCTLEMSGKHLLFVISIDGGWISLKVALLDRVMEPELIVTVGDGRLGWTQLCSLVRMFERDGIKSLVKPIELGGGRFVIGG